MTMITHKNKNIKKTQGLRSRPTEFKEKRCELPFIYVKALQRVKLVIDNHGIRNRAVQLLNKQSIQRTFFG